MATITQILENKPEMVTLVTHVSLPRFHSDDVSATAILRILLDKYQIRHTTHHTFYPGKEGFTDETLDAIIYDIGLGMYDHHQPSPNDKHCLKEMSDSTIRKYSSVGLIWREIGHLLVPEEYVDEVYNNVIGYIDDQDNGFETNPLSYCLSCMNCSPNKESASIDDEDDYADEYLENIEFEEAVSVMIKFFINIFYTMRSKKEESDIAKNIINTVIDNCKELGYNPPYVVTEDNYVNCMAEECSKANIPFYIYPNVRDGGYAFRAISPVGGGMSDFIIKIPQEVREWEGVTFLHPSTFLGAAVSLKRAKEVVEEVIRLNNEK